MSREQGTQTVDWQVDAKLNGGPQRSSANSPFLGEALS